LATSKAISTGYANLFREMAIEANIEVVIISGYSKG